MMKYFILEYWMDEGWYVGKLKDVPGVFSQGKTLDELVENIKDAYKLMMEDVELPIPSSKVQTKKIGVKV